MNDLSKLLTMPGEALDTEDEAVDPSFDLDSSIKNGVDHVEWV